jgi:hypothetical protein
MNDGSEATIQRRENMKLFHGKETIVQQAMPAMPSICTPLGTVEFSLSVSNQSYLATDCAKLNSGGWLYRYYYDSWDCELAICRVDVELACDQAVEECWGAVFRIQPKSGHQIDECNFTALWKEGYNWTSCGSDTGEGLEAIEYNNQIYQLHIGTQDGALLMGRKNQGDRIPKSFGIGIDVEAQGYILSSGKGISVPMSQMESDEICDIHVVIAWKKYEEEDVSTWLAVDQFSKDILRGEGLS